jgi:hypothetical protein
VVGDSVEAESEGESWLWGKDGLRGDLLGRPSNGERRYVHQPWEVGRSVSVLTLRRFASVKGLVFIFFFWGLVLVLMLAVVLRLMVLESAVVGGLCPRGLSSSQTVDVIDAGRFPGSIVRFVFRNPPPDPFILAKCCAGIAGTGGTSDSNCQRRGVG